MPKSKTRGSLKEHRQRVQHRNNTQKGLRRKMQEEYQAMFEKTMETLKAQYQNENGETVELSTEVIGDVSEINVNDVEVVTPEVNDED